MIVLAAAASELGDLPGAIVGIGPVRAGIGTARLLAGARPSAVVLVGTAGSYEGGPEVGQVIVGRRLGLSGGIADLGLGYVPLAPEPMEADLSLADTLGLVAADVLTVEAVTTDAALTRARGQLWQVEHMEAWSVAAAAQAAGVPFLVVLGIANRVGPEAHAEWLLNHGTVEVRVREVVRGLLELS